MSRNWDSLAAELNKHYFDKKQLTHQPSIKEEKVWDRWKKTLRSDEVLTAVWIPQFGYFRSCNMSLLGKRDNEALGADELKQLFHSDYRDLVFLINHRVLLLLIQYQKVVNLTNYVFDCTRALKRADGKFYYAKYRIKPWQTDDRGRLLSYIGRYTFMKPYSGESFYHEFNYEGKLNGTIALQLAELNKELRGIVSATVTDFFGLTEKRVEVIRQLSAGRTTPQIAEAMGLGKAGVKDHMDYIRKKAQSTVSTYAIRTAADGADFFVGMGLMVAPPLRGVRTKKWCLFCA